MWKKLIWWLGAFVGVEELQKIYKLITENQLLLSSCRVRGNNQLME